MNELEKQVNMHATQITVTNRQGLHARPVTQFAQLANQYDSKIEVTKGELTVDGKSVMSMLRLGAACGTVLNITAQGGDAPEAVAKLVELVESFAARDTPPEEQEN